MKHSRNKISVLFVLLGIFAAVSLALASPSTQSPRGDRQGKVPGIVHKTGLVQRVTVAGTVLPNRRTVFLPPYNAYIRKLFVKIGDEVKAGDPVVSLAQSLRSSSEENYPLRAPFNGTVVQVLKTEGEYLEQGKDNNAIARIDDLSRLFITADVPESDITKITVGQEVLIKASGTLSRPYRGNIREISIAAKERKDWDRPGERVEFPIRIEILDKDEKIRPGMSTIVDIITDKRDSVLTLPHEFIERIKEDYFVTLENGERRKVEIGLQNEELFEIKSGVSEGQRVRMVDFISLPEEG